MTMKTKKYDLEQVERDFKYYKERDKASDESIYFMLHERYKNRMEIAYENFKQAIKISEGENK